MEIISRQMQPEIARINGIINWPKSLWEIKTQFVGCCQEGVDKDSGSALLDDIAKLAPSEPLYLAPGMVRLDPAVTLTCQEHWTGLWVCLAAVCCSSCRSTDLAAFEKQRAGWFALLYVAQPGLSRGLVAIAAPPPRGLVDHNDPPPAFSPWDFSESAISKATGIGVRHWHRPPHGSCTTASQRAGGMRTAHQHARAFALFCSCATGCAVFTARRQWLAS